MRNNDSCKILSDVILQALGRGSTIIRVKDIGIPLTSFDRYLRNPLFDFVKGSSTFSIKWSDSKIQTIYSLPFSRLVDLNRILVWYPDIMNCALKMWTSPFAKGYDPGRANLRDQVAVKVKRQIDLFWNLYKAAIPIENPVFNIIVKPVIIEEAQRRLTGNSLLVQYNIRPNMQLG